VCVVDFFAGPRAEEAGEIVILDLMLRFFLVNGILALFPTTLFFFCFFGSRGAELFWCACFFPWFWNLFVDSLL